MDNSVTRTEPSRNPSDSTRDNRTNTGYAPLSVTDQYDGLEPTAHAPDAAEVVQMPETVTTESGDERLDEPDATHPNGEPQSDVPLPPTERDDADSTRTREWSGRSTTSRSESCRAGQVVADFELIEELGHGGMGVVYRARQRAADRLVALKMIRPELLDCREPDRVDSIFNRFRTEARAAARLSHDHIVTVYDVGEFAGRPYYSMRLIEGTSLSEMISDGPLTNEHAARIFEPIARAVHHAHTSGIIHRDIKPSNILLDTAGRPFIADFGLARWLAGDSGVTASGERLGTPSYMSPEQAGGTSPVGIEGDIYSLGASLYHALTGRPPFRAADPVETMRQVIDQEPVAPRKLNRAVARDLETICLKCLEKNPGNRFPDAKSVAIDLALYLEGKPIHARPAGPVERLVKWARLRPASAALICVCGLAAAAVVGAVVWERERSRARRAESLVGALETAEIGRVPQIVRELADVEPRSDRLVADRLLHAPAGSPARLNLSLAAVAADPRLADDLVERMLIGRPAEVGVIRDFLRPLTSAVSSRLRGAFRDPRADRGRRLRAACGLAADLSASPDWSELGPDVASWLIAPENRFLLGDWLELLRSVRGPLIGPLSKAFRESERLDEREAAAFALAAYVDEVEPLFELLGSGEASQSAVLIEKLRALTRPDTGRLEAKLISALEAASALPGHASQEISRRTANYALALLALERALPVWPLFRHGEIDDLRTDLIHRAAEAGVAAQSLARRANDDPDPSIRTALLLALGEYPLSRLSHTERDRLKPNLRKVYATDADPGIHSAAWWLLMRWGDKEELARADASLASSGPIEGKRWYATRNGHTMAVVSGPVEFVMGSHEIVQDRKDEGQHRVRIGRTFAIATRETTIFQFGGYDLSVSPENDGSQSPDSPISNRSYIDCVAYCRWLTAQEGMTDERHMCYPPIETFVRDGMRPYPDYLERPGYRLPTEAEWEFTCRAGALTARPFGRFEDYISRYAWWLPESGGTSHPVGLKKPNDLGLFDMLGNLSEWCSDTYQRYDATMADPIVDDRGHVGDDAQRVLRGGAYFSSAGALRSATRSLGHGGEGVPFFGFRVARTLPATGDR